MYSIASLNRHSLQQTYFIYLYFYALLLLLAGVVQKVLLEFDGQLYQAVHNSVALLEKYK